MTYSFTQKKRFRRSFSKHSHQAQIPSLLQLQRQSYKDFLQREVPSEKRENIGLQSAFNAVFPIVSNSGAVSLEFKSYEIADPIYSIQECKERGLSYVATVYANLEMVIRERNKVGTVKAILPDRVYMGDLPMITDYGSFIINGTERVVVSQMHRSPGVFFEHDSGRGSLSKKFLFSARIIPYNGRWLDFEFDLRELVYFRIDRRRKMPVTILLKAIGFSVGEILRTFYEFDEFVLGDKENESTYFLNAGLLQNSVLPFDIPDDKNEVLIPKGQRIKKSGARRIEKLKNPHLPVEDSFLHGKRLATDITDGDGEIIAKANTAVDAVVLAKIREAGIKKIHTLHINEIDRGPYISNTLVLDEKLDMTAARFAIYRTLRPGEPPSVEVVNNYLDNIFFNRANYNLSDIGRMKLNHRLDTGRPAMEYRLWIEKNKLAGKAATEKAARNLVAAGCFDSKEEADEFLTYITAYDSRSLPQENLTKEAAEALSKSLPDVPHEVLEQTTLSRRDIMDVVRRLVDLRNGKGKADDIDSLTNRRVRIVGEFITKQFEQGLLRVDRAIRDRLSRAESEELQPHDLISAKAITSSVAEFFNGNQLSQFMDQTNPLSEITHKRRVSALGAGGLTRDRVGFEVRDVHPTHYGRICPVETPEGQNIGLINSMGLFSSVNDYGFMQTRYYKAKNGKPTDEVVDLSAIEEEGKTIAQSDILDKTKKSDNKNELITARKDGEYVLVKPEEVDYVDISPAQITSVAASMIPFLEHNDANRALMGSNMQRQAVPCLVSEKPFVGTGIEARVALDAGTVVRAERPGRVTYVDSQRIVISINKSAINKKNPLGVDIYNLIKHTRSNQNTDINQLPIVKVGDLIKENDVIADGAGTDLGELSLGQNLLVAFLPWNGYNFEDSILISERVVMDQRFTSLHIIEEVVHMRSTPLGDEEITRDIPHQSEAALRNLDDEGIIRVGVEVHPGDILVGKLTPKSERLLSPEDKLLQAVFGEKANDNKDNSLKMPPGSSGVVIDVKVFTGEEIRKKDKGKKGGDFGLSSRRADEISEEDLRKYKQKQETEQNFVEQDAVRRIAELLKEHLSAADYKALEGKKPDHWFKQRTNKDAVNEQIEAVVESVKSERELNKKRLKEMERKFKEGHDLPQGILKTVRVYVAIKRPLQVGDKMAGRHGNKGVVSKIEAVESMPYLEDGTPVDVVLNPLGVPSRMNIGQVLETHLGFAAKGIGKKIDEMLHIKKKEQVKVLREYLGRVYQSDKTCNIDDLNNDEVIELAKNLSAGVPFATPIFDGATEKEIHQMLKLAGLPESGQVTLYDGRSGEAFDRPVTVGYMYILKLHHLVDEKMHSRATGPYSLVTQQPLGGKAQRGGQRFGEMEVWALEAYGAAHTLCEMLTIKSDDINNRSKMFENIVEGDFQLKSGVPESFNVLVQEIKAMGIDMDLDQKS